MKNKNCPILLLILPVSVISSLVACAEKKSGSDQEYRPQDLTMTRELQESFTPQEILQFAKEGNQRFVSGRPYRRDLLQDQKLTVKGQYPAAIILSCIDSRAPAEIIFDLGIGDIFNARVAGNFINTDIAGSIEYACKVAGSKLVLVMGHTHCGAVKSACDGVELGNITGMLANIKPAIQAVQDIEGERNSKNPKYVAAVAKQNVLLTKEKITEISPILKEMAEDEDLLIVGCMYDIETGRVEFYQ
jgi:carbonic anhydrase